MAKRVVEYEVDDEGNPIEPEPEQNPMEAQPPTNSAAEPREEEQEEREDVRPHVTQRYVARQPQVAVKPKYRLRKPAAAPQQPQPPKPQLSLEEQIVEVTKQENRAYYLYTQTADQEIMRIIKDLQLKKAQLLHEKRRREEEVRRSQIYGQMMYNSNNVNADPYIAEMMHSRAPPAFNMPTEPQPPTPVPQMLPLDQNQFPQPMPQQMPMQRPQQYQYPQQQQLQYPQQQPQAQYPQQPQQQQQQQQTPPMQPQMQYPQQPQQPHPQQYPQPQQKKQGVVERLAPHMTTVIMAGIGIAALYYLFLK